MEFGNECVGKDDIKPCYITDKPKIPEIPRFAIGGRCCGKAALSELFRPLQLPHDMESFMYRREVLSEPIGFGKQRVYLGERESVELVPLRIKPQTLFPGETSTEDILGLIEEKEESMESLAGKKIKRVTIECSDGKTYVGNVKRIEGNPYIVGGTIVEAVVGAPVGKHCIKEVIFANPTTIVKWTDGTETVVHCMDNAKVIEKVVDGKKIKKRKPFKCDTYSKEVGLAMAISKKFFGNEGNYNKIFKDLCGVEE